MEAAEIRLVRVADEELAASDVKNRSLISGEGSFCSVPLALTQCSSKM